MERRGAAGEPFAQRGVGEHHQGALRRRGADGGEEGVRRRQIEEERGERVDRGGEPPRHVGVEALAGGGERHPPLGGAARDGAPGALDFLAGREVEAADLVVLAALRVAQGGGGPGGELAREESQHAPAEPLLRHETLGIDQLQGDDDEHVVAAPGAAPGELPLAGADGGGQIIRRPLGERGVGRRQGASERGERRAQPRRLPGQSGGEFRRRHGRQDNRQDNRQDSWQGNRRSRRAQQRGEERQEPGAERSGHAYCWAPAFSCWRLAAAI